MLPPVPRWLDACEGAVAFGTGVAKATFATLKVAKVAFATRTVRPEVTHAL